jgi:hypothetical protein
MRSTELSICLSTFSPENSFENMSCSEFCTRGFKFQNMSPHQHLKTVEGLSGPLSGFYANCVRTAMYYNALHS